jgi:plasmid stabilization system protein ParE
MRIIWSPLAIERVTEIALYIAEDKPGASEKWVDSVFESVEKLTTFPKSGRIVPEIAKDNFREIIHGNYRIIYSISENIIEILTVRHGMQLLSESDITSK